jgi:hypothetical protein
VFGLDDAPNRRHLRKDAVFETGNETLDLLGSWLRLAEGERTSPTQGHKWGLEPLQRSGIVSFEELYRLTVDARQPQQPIRLVRLKPARSLPALKRPRGNEKDLGKHLQRQCHKPKDPQERAKGESLLDFLVQGRSVERSQAKQDDVRVGTSGATDSLKIRVDLWSTPAVPGCWWVQNLLACHMADVYRPYGRLSRSVAAAERIPLKLRAQYPLAQGGGAAEKKGWPARQRNSSLLASAPQLKHM